MNAYRVVGRVAVAVLALAGIGAVSQTIAARRDQRRFPAPGRLIDVGGHRLHINVVGEQTTVPAVILEAGMASMSSNWAWVRDDLARDGLVVYYDRAGLGWSDRGGGSMDAVTSAAELHTALEAAGIDPPYVLAGHSYGGLVVRMFADRYPDEVVGMVLADASHPDQWANIPASLNGRTVAVGNRVMALLAASACCASCAPSGRSSPVYRPASTPKCAPTWRGPKGGRPEQADSSPGVSNHGSR